MHLSLWQRAPSQHVPLAPAPASEIGQAAESLYNLSLSGARPGGLVQYLIAAGVVGAFTQPTAQVVRALDANPAWSPHPHHQSHHRLTPLDSLIGRS